MQFAKIRKAFNICNTFLRLADDNKTKGVAARERRSPQHNHEPLARRSHR